MKKLISDGSAFLCFSVGSDNFIIITLDYRACIAINVHIKKMQFVLEVFCKLLKIDALIFEKFQEDHEFDRGLSLRPVQVLTVCLRPPFFMRVIPVRRIAVIFGISGDTFLPHLAAALTASNVFSQFLKEKVFILFAWKNYSDFFGVMSGSFLRLVPRAMIRFCRFRPAEE